jgi:hypothetical protein
MQTKILKLKILQRMQRKFAAKQQNHQNVLLFHETIPLKVEAASITTQAGRRKRRSNQFKVIVD